MITKSDVTSLARFNTHGYYVSSLYLNVNGKRFNKKDYEIKLKALVRERKQEIDGLGLSQEAQNSVLADFDRIRNFVSMQFDGKRAKSLAIFSCKGLDLWQVYLLPYSIHPRLVVSKQPYLRPLVTMLADNKRYLAIIVSRDKARLFEYYLGTLKEHSKILDEVPSQVKMSGWYGLEERRIERHIDDYVHRHFKNVSEGVFEYYQNSHPDWVILGGRKNIVNEFERHLHSDIQEKIIDRVVIDVDSIASDIVVSLQSAVNNFETKEQKRLLKRLFEERGPGGLGITGLKATLRALWHGQVNILFVTEDYAQPGYYCPECWYMSDNEKICTNDKTPMKKSHDIIEDAIETAIFQNCEIIRVKDKKILAGEHENIGALLRFKI